MAKEESTKEKRKSKVSKILTAVSAVLVVLLVGLLAFSYITKQGVFKDKNILAEVGDEKVYLKDYKDRLFVKRGGTPESPEGLDNFIKEPILNELIEQKIIEQEMRQKGITISEGEITQKIKDINHQYTLTDSIKEAFREDSIFLIGQEKLRSKVLTWKEGYILYCRFDHKGDEATQKPYAAKYCQDMKTRLESGQSTLESELPKLNNDTVIGANVWLPKAISLGAKFNKNFPLRNLGGSDEAEQIGKGKVSGQYQLITVKGTQVDNKDKELAYAVVYIKDKGSEGETTNFEDWLKGQWKKYKIITYPERIKI